MPICLKESDLRNWLEGTSSEEQQMRIARHVEECVVCQQRLERTIVESDAIPAASALDAQATVDSEALTAVIHSLKIAYGGDGR